MYQELVTLAEDFARYRGQKKRVKYPAALWEKAIKLCEHYPQEKVSGSLQVSNESLRRHLRSRNKNRGSAAARFVPITVTSHPSIQLHVKGQLSITIDFDRSTEELAKFILAIQGGPTC